MRETTVAKKLMSFLVGVGLASAWWSMTVWPDWKGDNVSPYPLIPIGATFVFLIVAAFQLTIHWDDR